LGHSRDGAKKLNLPGDIDVREGNQISDPKGTPSKGKITLLKRYLGLKKEYKHYHGKS